MTRQRLLVLLALAMPGLLAAKCLETHDPPGEGLFILGVRVELPEDFADRVLSGGQGETLEGLSGMDVVVSHVEVVHRTDPDDPLTESVIALDETGGTIALLEGLDDTTPRQLLTLAIPVGYVMQFRLVVEGMTISFDDGSVFDVKLPSAAQSGVKIEPIDGVPFEVIDGDRTGGRIVFRPFEQIVRNQGQEFIFKPLLAAEHIADLTVLTGTIPDRVVTSYAVYDPDADVFVAKRCPVDAVRAHAAKINAEVIAFDAASSYFVFQIDSTATQEEAYRHFLRAVVPFEEQMSFFGATVTKEYWCKGRFVLPDFPVGERTAQELCDPVFEDDPYRAVAAPDAWDDVDGTAGDPRVAIAVVDGGFDLDHPDLVDRWYLNVGELPHHAIGPRWVDPWINEAGVEMPMMVVDGAPIIAAGQTLIFRNESSEPHLLEFDYSSPQDPVELQPGAQVPVLFDTVGEYTFSCGYHNTSQQIERESGRVTVINGQTNLPNFDLDEDGDVDSDDVGFIEGQTGSGHDGVLTLRELNVAAVQLSVCGTSTCLDIDNDGQVTALDLVGGTPFTRLQGAPGTSCENREQAIGLEDRIDNDGNGFCDDILGWDFGDNDNLPEGSAAAHGTQMAVIIGGKGGPAQSGVCTEEHGAGMMWGGVRLLPVKPGSVPTCANDGSCLGGRVCVSGLCLSCSEDAECATGEVCSEAGGGRRCTPECETHEDCPSPFICGTPTTRGEPLGCIVEHCTTDEQCTRPGTVCRAGDCLVLNANSWAQTTRAENVIGIRYAYGFDDVRVANFSRGLILFKEEAPEVCGAVAYIEDVGESVNLDLDGDGIRETDKWDTFQEWLGYEMNCLDSEHPISGTTCNGVPSGKLLVAAAGNCRYFDLDPAWGDDDVMEWPSEFIGSGGLVVGSVDEVDVLSGTLRPGSLLGAWGEQDVDLLAPGLTFLHDKLDGTFDLVQGSSPAAAETSGVIGLVMARFPQMEGQTDVVYRNNVREHVTAGATQHSCLEQGSVHGVLDACAALKGKSVCGSGVGSCEQ